MHQLSASSCPHLEMGFQKSPEDVVTHLTIIFAAQLSLGKWFPWLQFSISEKDIICGSPEWENRVIEIVV